ncbi:MAG: hypothetical protein M5U01_07115 [Ardenticatenaceae bacterium]|nr:hypothetical protein [Ardenticatenaceae bacterium]
MIDQTGSNSREDVLALLAGRRSQRIPCFSGLIHVTVPGLESIGLGLSAVHHDPAKMAAAAATTHRLFGFESAVVPLDMYVEAGVLGARVDFGEEAMLPVLPRLVEFLAGSSEELTPTLASSLRDQGRVPVVTEAIRILRSDVGQQIVIGAWVPGPFTLATLLVEITNLLLELVTAPESVGRLLDGLTDVLVEVASVYRAAGADFITVHEMGGSPGFIGPPAFTRLVLPRLQRLLAALPPPRVLSVCGNTNRSMPLLAEAGADALSVDQTNDLAHSREVLGREVLLFGNIDPVGTLTYDDETGVRHAVTSAVEAGVDAIWPGCDLWPRAPAANLRALVDEALQHRRA